ncbi:unnamed protein product [Toxocara canis]|uniref:Ig-like domain-containing protein n=1 Tax=Toxocara canis TaxID=6265 RepID=A0A183VG44_TOXCA|nr:unnamed protein product [Toxocara canis]
MDADGGSTHIAIFLNWPESSWCKNLPVTPTCNTRYLLSRCSLGGRKLDLASRVGENGHLTLHTLKCSWEDAVALACGCVNGGGVDYVVEVEAFGGERMRPSFDERARKVAITCHLPKKQRSSVSDGKRVSAAQDISPKALALKVVVCLDLIRGTSVTSTTVELFRHALCACAQGMLRISDLDPADSPKLWKELIPPRFTAG